MRVALVSDLHGNDVALRAVLSSIARAGVDQIVCLGDTATLGPRPGAVLARLREAATICIMGNHDAFLLDPDLIRSYSQAPFVVGSVDWCRSQLSADDLAFVRTFQPSVTLPLGDGAELFLFHGSPRSHMEDLLATTPAERLDELLDGHATAVMASGHTHLQMLRQHRGHLLVNPGSVGLPFREYAHGGPPTLMPDHAEYAVVEAHHGEIGVTLRRVPVARADVIRDVRSSGMPMAEEALRQYA